MTNAKNSKIINQDERNCAHNEFHSTGYWRPVSVRPLAKFEILREKDLALTRIGKRTAVQRLQTDCACREMR
jgi:hypothetical protein